MSFQENLRFYREKAGYTSAKDFSKALNIPYNTYAGYESQYREPKYETLIKIADLLNVSTDELLGYEKGCAKISKRNYDRLSIRNRIMLEVEEQERLYGDEKELNPFQWLGLIQEELGETAQAVNERYLPDKNKSNKRAYGKYDIENEAYQTIALLFRFIEYLHKENKNDVK